MTDVRDDIDIEVLAADPEVEPDETVGGPDIPEPPDEEQVAGAVDGSIAARLAAVGEKLQRTRTHDFPIVVRDEDDEPFATIVMRARAFRDRKAFRQGVKTEVFIVRATSALFLRDEDTDELIPIPTWGIELARALNIPAASASELVQKVLGNPVAVSTFCADLINWMSDRGAQDEQALGE